MMLPNRSGTHTIQLCTFCSIASKNWLMKQRSTGQSYITVYVAPSHPTHGWLPFREAYATLIVYMQCKLMNIEHHILPCKKKSLQCALRQYCGSSKLMYILWILLLLPLLGIDAPDSLLFLTSQQGKSAKRDLSWFKGRAFWGLWWCNSSEAFLTIEAAKFDSGRVVGSCVKRWTTYSGRLIN